MSDFSTQIKTSVNGDEYFSPPRGRDDNTTTETK